LYKKANLKPGMVVHTYNQEVEAGDLEFEASLDYIMRSCLKAK
jgi:hypothetical protein